MTNTNIPLQLCKRILQEGNNYRISKGASEELSYALEDMAITISETAKKMASHAGRKTIKQEDIILAVETLEEK